MSRTAISLLYGASRLEGGAEGPVVGRFIDRLGPRPVILVGAALTGVGFLLLSLAQGYWSVFFIFVLIISLGYNAGFYHPISTAVNSWFIRRRGMGFAILDSVGSLGAVALVPLLAYWVHHSGWRTASVLVGVITLVAVLPVALLFHRSPESRGLLPDGGPAKSANNPAQGMALPVDFGVREAVRTGNYWLLTLTTTLRLTVTTAVTAHMVPMLVWRGVDEAQAAYLVSLFAFGCILTPLAFGWLGDRWGNKARLCTLGVLVGAGAAFWLWRSSSPLALYGFPIAMAVVLGTAPLNWSLVGDFFGRASYGTLRGIMRIANGAGAFLAPIYAGWVFDRTSSYELVLLPFALVLLLSAVLFFYLRPPTAPQRA